MSEGSLTHDQIEVACRNIGYDLTCGACAELFYTGEQLHAHDTWCKTVTKDKDVCAAVRRLVHRSLNVTRPDLWASYSIQRDIDIVRRAGLLTPETTS